MIAKNINEIKILTMSYDESISESLKLAETIAREGIIPDGIIGIATGGILPAQITSDYFHKPLILVKVTRPMSTIKKHFGLNRFPVTLKKFLRRIEMSLGIYRLMSKREISQIIGDIKPGKYIIVDDSLDTGSTYRKIIDLLKVKSIHRNDMIIAVLTQMYEDANPKADYSNFKNINFSFPWSQDSEYYEKFISFCNKNNIPKDLLT